MSIPATRFLELFHFHLLVMTCQLTTDKTNLHQLCMLKESIKSCFTKIRIKKDRLKPELEKLFIRREDILTKIPLAESNNNIEEVIKLRKDLSKVTDSISEISAEKNRERVRELVDEDDNVEGGIQGKIWALKRKLISKNCIEQPTAKKNEQGNLVTDKEALEALYVQTYKSRLSPNPTPPELEEHRELKSYLFELEVSLANLTKCKK